MASRIRIEPYKKPSGGWGAARAVSEILRRKEAPARGALALRRQNKVGEFKCVSCAWAKPAKPHVIEVCENGAKATAWELTAKRVTPEFFAVHTLSELATWADHDLESLGRLTHPLRWDAASDKYLPVAWDAAFGEIGRELRGQDPRQVVFYLCGHASLETAYMYQLLARMFGTNNMPNSSNMCHESTSVALPESIGVPVGTITLDDFPNTECLFFLGENVGTNAPRMLHDLQDARERDVPIVTFNPIRERGLERFQNPLSPVQMMTNSSTPISSHYYQVKVGGDGAAMLGVCKALLALDTAARSQAREAVLDRGFIAEHCHGFEDFAEAVRALSWDDLVRRSGISRADMEKVAAIYAGSNATIACYGMGLTQDRYGVETVQLLCNLMLMRGNVGKPGAGLCPVRGHSNIQGQRTVGHGHKPALVPLDKLAQQYGFEPPREQGYDTAETCGAILNGRVKSFIGLGGNFVRAAPDTVALEAAWRRLRLTVQVGTKLNRSHLIHGEVQFLLPCLGRIEIDRQASGPQVVTVEDATACIHVSVGRDEPASEHLLSEPKIVAELAKAILPPNPKLDWDQWVADYGNIRDAIAETYPEVFHDFNERMWTPGGFHRPLAARHRKWNTKTGKANFIIPHKLIEDVGKAQDTEVLQLFTLRSNDQFNTTVYSYDDRYRGVYGTRKVLLMNRNDMMRLNVLDGETVTVTTDSGDQVPREVRGLRATAYDVPEGCCAGYYPECNPLIPWWHHAEGSKTPAAKSIPVRVHQECVGATALES
jgi:molybdopterin-dependent oxidoreductase alpha subunit